MPDKALNAKEYASLIGVGYSTFRKEYGAHPDRFAPHFNVGKCRRWWMSTIVDFHKSKEHGGPEEA